MKNGSPWTIQKMKIESGFLYPHIQRVLQSSVYKEKISSKADDYLIYSLEEKSYEQLFFEEQTFFLESMKDLTFAFYSKTNKLLSPKLFICPDTNVGMLTLPTHFINNGGISISDLISFNYAIHKTEKQTIPNLLLRHKWNLQETETSISQTNSERERHIFYSRIQSIEKTEKKIQELLGLTKTPDSPVTFTMRDIVAKLLSYINVDYQLANDTRYHLFTYLQSKEKLPLVDKEITDDFIRICRTINREYHIANYDRKEAIMQLFDDIYVGASVEGSAMMITSKGTFFYDNYLKDTIQDRFLWLYYLAFMQRISLINMHKELSSKELDETSGNALSLDELRTEYQRLINMKVNTFFTDVSDYSQHNQFYQFCKSRLGVDRLFEEINDKMKQLDLLLSQKTEIKKEKYQNLLAIAIACLTVCSATSDWTDQWGKLWALDSESCCFRTWAFIWTIIIIALVAFFFFIYYPRKNKHKHNHKH